MSAPLLQNEEINYMLGVKSNNVTATVLALLMPLIAKFAQFVDTSVGEVSESASQRLAAFKELKSQLDGELVKTAAPLFGGVYVTEVQALDANTALVQPVSKQNEFDNPQATQEGFARDSTRR